MWDNEGVSQELKEFREYAEDRWLHLPSNTQFVESGVKEAKICGLSQRSERMRSIYALIRSHTTFNFLDVAKRQPRAKGEILKSNPSGTTRTEIVMEELEELYEKSVLLYE